jgi:hypothetical protein
MILRRFAVLLLAAAFANGSARSTWLSATLTTSYSLEQAPSNSDPSTGSDAASSINITKWIGASLVWLVASLMVRSAMTYWTVRFPSVGIAAVTILVVGNRTRYGVHAPAVVAAFDRAVALRWLALFCAGSALTGVLYGLLFRRAGMSLPTMGDGSSLPTALPSPASRTSQPVNPIANILERKRAQADFLAAQREHRIFAAAAGTEVGVCSWELGEDVHARARSDRTLLEAERGYLRALEQSDRLHEPINVAGAHFALACLYHLQGQMERVETECLACLVTIGQLPRLDTHALRLAGSAALNLGIIAARRGDRQSAESFLKQALETFTSIDDVRSAAAIRHELSRLEHDPARGHEHVG